MALRMKMTENYGGSIIKDLPQCPETNPIPKSTDELNNIRKWKRWRKVIRRKGRESRMMTGTKDEEEALGRCSRSRKNKQRKGRREPRGDRKASEGGGCVEE